VFFEGYQKNLLSPSPNIFHSLLPKTNYSTLLIQAWFKALASLGFQKL